VNEFLKDTLPKLVGYKGRIFGSAIGFIAGLLWAFMGFWRALAFVFCILLGFYLGKRIDQKGSLRELLSRVIPPND
jgi:uncharacterized membrane protein